MSSKTVLKEKVLPSVALSENVNYLVYTVDNDSISISALNTDDSEAIESMLLHGVSKLMPHSHQSLNMFKLGCLVKNGLKLFSL